VKVANRKSGKHVVDIEWDSLDRVRTSEVIDKVKETKEGDS
jgi:hypothetical protein